jgi:AraC family transcriptional regulator
MDYHVQQDLGIKRTVTCAVKDDHFADVTGVDADWFNPEFVNRLAYDDAAPRRILSAIGDELMTPRLARDVSIEGYCLVLLSEVARIAGRIKTEEGRSSAGLSRGQIDRLRELIEAKLHERLSVGMMADELGMSRGHLSRLFKATTGSTLKGYVESARLARIETLLAHSSLPLKTIASRVGLSSANYLSVAFARRSGMSPRQYRRSRAS